MTVLSQAAHEDPQKTSNVGFALGTGNHSEQFRPDPIARTFDRIATMLVSASINMKIRWFIGKAFGDSLDKTVAFTGHCYKRLRGLCLVSHLAAMEVLRIAAVTRRD